MKIYYGLGRRPAPQISQTPRASSSTNHHKRTTLRAAPSAKRNAAGNKISSPTITATKTKTQKVALVRGAII